MRDYISRTVTRRAAANSVGLASLVTVSLIVLASCSSGGGAPCVRYETRVIYQQVCLRRSDTGHCAHYGSRSSTQRVCVQRATTPPPARRSRAAPPARPAPRASRRAAAVNRNYLIGRWCNASGRLSVEFTRSIMRYHFTSGGPADYRVIAWDVTTSSAATLRFRVPRSNRIAGYRYVLTNNSNNLQIIHWLNPRTNRWQPQLGSIYKRC